MTEGGRSRVVCLAWASKASSVPTTQLSRYHTGGSVGRSSSIPSFSHALPWSWVVVGMETVVDVVGRYGDCGEMVFGGFVRNGICVCGNDGNWNACVDETIWVVAIRSGRRTFVILVLCVCMSLHVCVLGPHPILEMEHSMRLFGGHLI